MRRMRCNFRVEDTANRDFYVNGRRLYTEREVCLVCVAVVSFSLICACAINGIFG